MEFENPSETGFTIYSKSGCLNCSKIKKLLTENRISYNIIDCDDYIIEDKQGFLFFIKQLANIDVNVFPIIFNNGTFIGSYNETKDYVDKINCFDAI
jgi:glutaredoxin